MKPILVAGIGNIFLGDDAFGCEVVRELAQRPLPEDVQVIDFGIRGYDLAYALTGDFAAIILVDAMPRGESPGTTFLMELDPGEMPEIEPTPLDGHSLTPIAALQMAQSFGGVSAKVYLVGCEPAVLDTDGGQMGLSPTVRQAVPQALEMIESLVCNSIDTIKTAGLAPV